MFVEKKGTPSVPVSEESRSSGLPYVLTDIVTYFTMLVGIYFPSVTGEAPGIPGGQSHLLPPSAVTQSPCLCPPPPHFPSTLPSSPVFLTVWLKR